jgi:hypothetical protein
MVGTKAVKDTVNVNQGTADRSRVEWVRDSAEAALY